MVVTGSGNNNVSDYGSIGSYSITGVSTILPIQGVTLTGKTDGSKHDLDWSITSSDAIKSVVVEYSADGKNFSSLEVLFRHQQQRFYELYAVSALMIFTIV